MFRQPKRAEAVFMQAMESGIPINSRVLGALGRSVGRERAESLHAEGAKPKQNQPPWRHRA